MHFGAKVLPLVAQDGQDVSISFRGEKIRKDLIVVADGVGSKWKKTIFEK